MKTKFLLLHGAFQSPSIWKVPSDFSGNVICVDCSTLQLFQIDLGKILDSIEGTNHHICIVATSLGCIHGIRLANMIAQNGIDSISLVFCAVPSMVTHIWQTSLLTNILKYLNFLRKFPLPKWLARKVWTTPAHRENIQLLSTSKSRQDHLSRRVKTHIIFTYCDFLAGSAQRQETWVRLRSNYPVQSHITMFTHYPYIFDRKRFWGYLQNLGTLDV